MSEPKELQWGEEYTIRGVERSFDGQHIAAAMNAYAGVLMAYPVEGEPIRVLVPMMGQNAECALMNAVEYLMAFAKPRPREAGRVARWFADKYGEAPQ